MLAGIAPENIVWNADAQGGLLGGADVIDQPRVRVAPHVSKNFLSLAAIVLCHRDPHRHALLYRLLWRNGSWFSTVMDDSCDLAGLIKKTLSPVVLVDQPYGPDWISVLTL